MSRGRKPKSINYQSNWSDIFWGSLPTYIGILSNYFHSKEVESIEVGKCLSKLSFTIPKGLNSKEIYPAGDYPVISQSKEYTVGYSNRRELVVEKELPLIIFGDHSKTIKYVESPFIIGADGVKIIKPINDFNEKFFYYFLHGVITDTKDYGRHFSLLCKGFLPKVHDINIQTAVVNFLDDLQVNKIDCSKQYFDKEVENEIIELQESQLTGNRIYQELKNQQTLLLQLRQAFLKEAVRGKLVCQSPDDEPASELLKRIKIEKEKLVESKKLKREKELQPINEKEAPFDIPESWVWCRFGEICESSFYGPRFSNSEYVQNGIPTIRTTDMTDYGEIELKNAPCVFVKDKKKVELYKVNDGDLLLTRSGSIGIMAIFRGDYLAFPSAYLIRFRFMKPLFPEYIYHLLKSPYWQALLGLNSRATAQVNINATNILKLLIPLPPLSEQIRIVQKLEQLMNHCNKLEKSISQSKQYNEQLLQQVLKEALKKEEEVLA